MLSEILLIQLEEENLSEWNKWTKSEKSQAKETLSVFGKR